MVNINISLKLLKCYHCHHVGNEDDVATLIVRNIDDEIKIRLMSRAAENGRSMEAEVRDILKAATKEASWITQWLELTPRFGENELELPQRSASRELDLFSSKA